MRVTLSHNGAAVTLELTPEQVQTLGLGGISAGQTVPLTLTPQTEAVRADLMGELERLMDEQTGLYERLSNA